MADQQKPVPSVAGAQQLTPDTLAMIQAIVESMKKPYVDPDEEARKAKARQRLRDQREESERQIAAIQNSCTHLRDDNTSRVAWQNLYWASKGVYITDGYCQACNKHFAPGVEGYEYMLRVPVGKAGIIGA